MINKFKHLLIFFCFIAIFLANFSSCRSEKKQFRLPLTKPHKVGMSEAGLNRSRELIQKAISENQFPGAVLLVARKGKIVLREAFGASQLVPEQKKMEVDSLFDLAYADEKGNITEDALLWHLLTHTSGLPGYTDAAAAASQLGNPCSTESLVKYIAQLPKNGPPSSKYEYSCLGFITLAYILEKVSGQAFDDFVSERIFKPLRMEHTLYKPAENYLPKCAATLVVDGKPLIGTVHDPLARLQGGVSGNAGLFSTADDLAVFAQMLLQRGEFRGVRILSPLSVRRMTSVFEKVAFSGRGLGWDLASPHSSNSGDLFPAGSFGHTGYTGTSIWIDPATETFVIFLTNRVHPDDKGEVGRMRSFVANIVASSIISGIED